MIDAIKVLGLLFMSGSLVLLAGAAVYSVWRSGERGDA